MTTTDSPTTDSPTTDSPTTGSLFDFEPGLPIQQLEKELALASQLTALGERKLARYLFDMHERGVHMETGHATAEHYARSRLGMKEPEANHYLLAGRASTNGPDR